MNTLTGTGKVLRSTGVPSERSGFLGSCFAFRQPTHFLTAAHCVSGFSANEISVQAYHRINATPVSKIHEHPDADLAILELAAAPDEFTQPFWSGGGGPACLGLNFIAYGFPESIFDEKSRTPTPRLFKGHFQRTFWYPSPLGFKYEAGELSIPCPAGLSGGPIFRQRAHQVVLGVVTENLESMKVLESEEEKHHDGQVERNVYRSVINYGVCVLLNDPVMTWLDAHVPREPRYFSAKPLKGSTIAVESDDDEYYALL